MAQAGPGLAGVTPLGPEGFDWTTWHADPSVVLGVTVVAVAYLAAVYRRNGAGTRVEPLRIASFLGGLLVPFGALTGPIHDLSDHYLFSAHMIQHMLLVFAMPPLLMYGTPAWMLEPLLARTSSLTLARRPPRAPAPFTIFNVVRVACPLPPLYNLAMEHHPVHIVEHLMIMAASVILWWPILSPVSALPRAAYPIQLLYLFVVGLPMVMVAIFITMADTVL